MLDYNTTNPLDLPSDNNKENINPKALNNGEERIRLVDIDNGKEDIRSADIDKERLVTPNQIFENGLLSESFSTFIEVMFSKSEFLAGTPVSNTRYKYPRSQNNNLSYLFNGQSDYALAHYFTDSEPTKCNIDKFITNLLMKPFTKDLLYCNVDEQMEKLYTIPWGIPDDK